MTATNSTLEFTEDQTSTIIGDEFRKIGADGVSAVIGTDVRSLIRDETADEETPGATSLRLGEGQKEAIVSDYVSGLDDPYDDLVRLLGTDDFLKD